MRVGIEMEFLRQGMTTKLLDQYHNKLQMGMLLLARIEVITITVIFHILEPV